MNCLKILEHLSLNFVGMALISVVANALMKVLLSFQGGLEEFVLLSEESETLKGDGSLEDMSQLHPTASDTHLFQIIRRTELGEMAVK